MPATACLEIPRVDARGAAAANLFGFWNNVVANYDLDVSQHAGFACEGAAAIINRQYSFSQN